MVMVAALNTLPVSVTTPIARGVHAGDVVQLRRVVEPYGLLARLRPGDSLWLREPWHTGAHYDDVRPTALPDAAIIAFAADLPPEADPVAIGLGRRRFARELPKARHRAHLSVIEVRFTRLHNLDDDDAEAEGAPGKAAYPIWWNTHCSPEARTISGTPSRWADNPPVIIIAFDLVRGPMS
jgi:hypothetical protein